jgi:hypothetical protein
MYVTLKHLLLGSLLAVAVAGAAVHASDAVESKPLQFARGASSTTVEGTIQGYQTIDYKLRARAGQTMTVSLKTECR